MKNFFQYFAFIAAATLFAWSCATTEPVADAEEDEPWSNREPVSVFNFSDELIASYTEDVDISELSPDERDLYYTRSRLRSHFDTQAHDMPDFYLQVVSEEEIDINQGLRVQILSTRDIALADTTLAEFERWSEQAFADYVPQGYIRFRQPYYRVRVGDFHNREQAIELSRILKFRYPDAWVIHDQINPYRIPADSTEFRITDTDDEEPESGE